MDISTPYRKSARPGTTYITSRVLRVPILALALALLSIYSVFSRLILLPQTERLTQRTTLSAPETRITRHTQHISHNNIDGGWQSGNGRPPTKLSRSVLEKAIGPEVMRAIASVKAPVKARDVAGALREKSEDAAEDSSSALNTLIGTKTTGGALQVTVAGRATGVVGSCNISLLALIGFPVPLQ